MKTAFIYVPIVASFALLGAHFVRWGNVPGEIAAVLLIGLLFVRRPWVLRLLQLALVLGAIEWLYTLYVTAQMRIALGEPATRLVIILGSVAATTLASALLFQSATLRRIYKLEAPADRSSP